MEKSRLTNKVIIGIVVIIMIVAALLLFRGCSAIVGNNSGSDQDTTIVDSKPADTVFINVNPDTVYMFDTIIHTIINPIPYEVYKDTAEQLSGPGTCDSTRVYLNNVVGDSGSVSVVSTVRGEMVKQDVSVELRTMIISDIDTVRIEIPCPDNDKVRKGVWTIGGAFNSAIQPSVWATYGNNGRSVLGGYNFIDGRITLGAGICIGGRQ